MTARDAPLWLAYRVVGGRPSYGRDDVARVRHRGRRARVPRLQALPRRLPRGSARTCSFGTA